MHWQTWFGVKGFYVQFHLVFTLRHKKTRSSLEAQLLYKLADALNSDETHN